MLLYHVWYMFNCNVKELGVMKKPNLGRSLFKHCLLVRRKLVHWLNAFSGWFTSEGPEATLHLYEIKLPVNYIHIFIILFLYTFSNCFSKADVQGLEVYEYSIEKIVRNFTDFMLLSSQEGMK